MNNAQAQCPHCDGWFNTNRGSAMRHIRCCPSDPARFDAIKAALTGDDGCAAGHDRYSAVAQRAGLPSRSTLCKTFGTWADALSHFGVPMSAQSAVMSAKLSAVAQRRPRRTKATRAELADAAVGAEIDAVIEANRAEVEWARFNADRGLAVAQHDGTPCVRQLRGGAVACMLR